MTCLKCHRSCRNEGRLWLGVTDHRGGNLWGQFAQSQRIKACTLTSVQRWLVKTGGRLMKHARYYWLLLAESHLTRRLFGAMLRRIDLPPLPAG